jgi:sec-independent protein translocase protein TatB
MFDLGWTEILIIAVIALIVIGPKDLPSVLKNVAYWVRKARGLGREFQRGVDDLVREAELDDVQKEIKTFSRGDLGRKIEKTIDPTGSIKRSLKVDEPAKARTVEKPVVPETVAPAVTERAAPTVTGQEPESPAAVEAGDGEAAGEPKPQASA